MIEVQITRIGGGIVWEGRLPAVPREGENVFVDEVSIGYVKAVLWSIDSGSETCKCHVRLSA